MALRKVLIANRGEIAVRIIRAAQDLGLATVQVYSAADRDMLAVRLADEAVEIGPAQASRSYLNGQAILQAARETCADAIHPGYGFLAENADFAQAVEAAGRVFIGPRHETIRTMGDKATARAQAQAAGVSVVPGSQGVLHDISLAPDVAGAIGYPVMIKAAAGGGGRGIRIARTREELMALLPQAAAEAEASFGEAGLYLERFLARARHIEVQVLGDGVDVIHLYERECSLQRRRQKVWEEAPAGVLPSSKREELCAASVRLAQSCGYRGAGTLEYLYDEKTGEHFFIEMNTRIQVEHPVTEMVTGIDLVKATIRIAAGEALWLKQSNVTSRGHAIEVRINAEDPAKDFRPSPGTLSKLQTPGGFGVRFDTFAYAGYTVPPYYDSLLGKLIVWDESRDGALARLRRALGELQMGGLQTTALLHAALARAPDVIAGRVHTLWLEEWLKTAPLAAAVMEDVSP